MNKRLSGFISGFVACCLLVASASSPAIASEKLCHRHHCKQAQPHLKHPRSRSMSFILGSGLLLAGTLVSFCGAPQVGVPLLVSGSSVIFVKNVVGNKQKGEPVNDPPEATREPVELPPVVQ